MVGRKREGQGTGRRRLSPCPPPCSPVPPQRSELPSLFVCPPGQARSGRGCCERKAELNVNFCLFILLAASCHATTSLPAMLHACCSSMHAAAMPMPARRRLPAMPCVFQTNGGRWYGEVEGKRDGGIWAGMGRKEGR